MKMNAPSELKFLHLNFLNIVYRGLLLPRVGVEQHGIERTDIGNLGGGIYFSDSLKSVVFSITHSSINITDLLIM